MSPKAKALHTVGTYGCRVAVMRRSEHTLELRYRKRGVPTSKALQHNDLKLAKQQAQQLSLALANARALQQGGAEAIQNSLTVAQLLARYQLEVSDHKKSQSPTEDKRRRRLWVTFLGARRLAKTVGPSDVRAFIAARAKGAIVVKDIALTKKPKPRTIDADVVYLQSAYNWAYREARLLTEEVLRGSIRPQVSEQMRPMATHERAAKLLEHAHTVHSLFPLLMICVYCLGWRISAICGLRREDINRTPTKDVAPHGWIRKDWRRDKEDVGAWVPMPKAVRDAIDAAGIIGTGWVFTAVKDPKKCWSRSYARDLLERAEKLAKLEPLEGGDFHPYRRLWATDRKHFPIGDVANAGNWKDLRSPQRYTLADPRTTSAVMLYDPTAPEVKSEPKSEPKSKTARTHTKRGPRHAANG